ncbi:5'-nucleotidase C-terminal domain-containing protein [Pararhodonellum marinum]|uniref:5'-nucleotidase C-terminal domain-containing protein n=1 Tax=Pararhodonellum marinum TaxID=2755358 RepID=UPI00188E1398|nr:5'-nucleotidase [Pararhodonellum marinum]
MSKATTNIRFWGFPMLFLWITSCAPYLIQHHEYKLVDVDNQVSEKTEFIAFIQPYKAPLDAEMNRVIAEGAKELSKKRGESPLGNLVADLQKEFTEEHFQISIDISLMNNGGLRNSLPEGDITVGSIFELSPFDNYLYVLEMQASDIKRLVNYIIAYQNLGISGMTLETENKEVKSLLIQGKPLDESSTYSVAINDYLANGGDQMEFLKDLPRLFISEITLRDMLMKKITSKGEQGIKIDAQIEGRQIFN